ncbi:MAG TPA: CDP-diacylglycerol--serine O-phosphatidyltransferase, partial [candidate division Zixibacteria bacterium]|nr:CDP-diacylglycerol--serine O-phosphatidyltransferase [candidate division Zixibacteria bacterium]
MSKKRIKRFAPIVPGIFTMGNMFSGFVSILHSTAGKTISGAWLIILGAVFDLLDGKIARMTRTTSEIGVQLDSFSDFLTFGVAPGVLLF